MLKRYLNKEEVKSSEELFKVIAQVSTWYPHNKRIEIILLKILRMLLLHM